MGGVFQEITKPGLAEGECEIEIPFCKERAGGEDNNRRRGGENCKEDENWEDCRSGRTVSGNGESKQTSGNQVADELFNVCFTTGEIPAEWRRGVIVLIWKGKGDIHDPGRYRSITLLSQALKLMERVLDARVRNTVESKIGENQLGFRKGRGMDDGLFIIRQIIEKRREFRKDVTFGFVDLEKAFDTVLRELAFAVMRWMEVGEAEVRIVDNVQGDNSSGES